MEFRLNEYGFVRVAVLSPELRIANIDYNLKEIERLIRLASEKNAQIILFPELSITGYSCEDLFFQNKLINDTLIALKDLCNLSKNIKASIIVGAPIFNAGKLYNAAIFINNGEIKGIIPKSFLPNYNEFYEKRWFFSAFDSQYDFVEIERKQIPFGNDLIFSSNQFPDLKIGIEICEDLWAVSPISSKLALTGANLILNLSSSNELIGKSKYRRELIANQSARINGIYAYSDASPWESTTDLVFSGHCIIAENGKIIEESKRFQFDSQMIIADCDFEMINNERNKNSSFNSTNHYLDFRDIKFDLFDVKVSNLYREISPSPFVPNDKNKLDAVAEEILNLQSTALARRLLHLKMQNCVIGLSGGLDSTLAMLIAVESFKKLNLPLSGIYTITMPGFGTTIRTKSNAELLAQQLGTTLKVIDVKNSTRAHFQDIEHNEENINVVFENAQARRRTHILMDYANKVNGVVIGTGDLSEIALGWNTYNADQMSMYNVNASVPKTLVQFLIEWYKNNKAPEGIESILQDILQTPISPELQPSKNELYNNQETEKIIGPYQLHDFFLYYGIRFALSPRKIFLLANFAFENNFSKEEIISTMEVFYKRFFANQFKRSCFPDGVKIGTVALSPRGDWRMPSDASVDIWIKEIEDIKNSL
ncbi:MAG TPA: NAD(+) synthase [Candidatus Kapabacteria bacterium]|nr:NAD(+) synthase [Candidatus Kapabacteria bacterium]